LLTKQFDSWRGSNQVNIVLSNPPFGGQEEDDTEKNFPVEFRTKETADASWRIPSLHPSRETSPESSAGQALRLANRLHQLVRQSTEICTLWNNVVS